MSFWNLSEEDKTVTSYEAPSGGGGGDWFFADGQELLCVIEQITKKQTKNGNKDYFSIQWGVMAPEKDAKGITMKNRKVFQSIYPEGSDYDDTADKVQKKADKARWFLLAIDGQCGHKLFGTGVEPTAEALLSAWSFKPMTVRVGLMKDRETKVPSMNYVQAIGAPKAESDITRHEGVWANPAPSKAATTVMSQGSALDGDDIPFAPCF